MTNAIDMSAVSPVEAQVSFMSPDLTMVVLTWVTFFLLAAILYKFAWNPIIKALDERERLLLRSVEDADRIKEEFSNLKSTREQFIHDAQQKSKEIINEAHKAAIQISDGIHAKAREEAGILLANARQDIKKETEKGRILLREESSQLVVDLAAKLIEKNLNTDDNRKLVCKLMTEI